MNELTDTQINEVIDHHIHALGGVPLIPFYAFVRDIIAADRAQHEAQRPAEPDLTIAYMSGVADGKARRQAGQKPVDLHAALVNLPCQMPDWSDVSRRTAYRLGHKDARHAAAELALQRAALQPAQLPEGWIEIRLPQDGQAIEGKSAIDAPVWIEDYDMREPLSNMRFWRPAPDYPR